MNSNQLDIEVRDTVLDPDVAPSNATVLLRKEERTVEFRVYLYLEGYDLPYIESVTYTLHQSMSRPNRTVRRTPSNPNCKLAIWTSGVFVVKATIVDVRGSSFTLEHRLTYDQALPSEKDKYVYENQASLAPA